MKLLGSTKYLIIKTKNEEIVQSLFLVKCNLVDNQYQQKSEVLYTFTPNKSYAYLLNVDQGIWYYGKLTAWSLMKLS